MERQDCDKCPMIWVLAGEAKCGKEGCECVTCEPANPCDICPVPELCMEDFEEDADVGVSKWISW